eukprot:CCRYP_003556-RA/>CCRYP_003556-RA protein AED:0.36 eAED:0.36 QI:308/1/1/1/0.42/0.25/8/2235/455
MDAQRRQYRVYGIGKKVPVGIIKQRVKKLNSLGFHWDSPTTGEEGLKNEKHFLQKKKPKIKHNLLSSEASRKSKEMGQSQECHYLARSSDFVHPHGEIPCPMQQTQSSRGRVRMPSRRMQESCDVSKQNEMSNDVEQQVGHRDRSEDEISLSGTSGDGSQDVGKPKSRIFPGILLDLVNDTSSTNPEIIEWLPCGTAFRINDEDAMGEVLQKYFRHNKLSSFIRQLNLYGFSKQIDGDSKGAFKHPLFNRNSVKEYVNTQLDRAGSKAARKLSIQATSREDPLKKGPGRPSRTEVEGRYIKQVCNQEGCYKYKAPHCGGFCMAHFNLISGITKTNRGRGRPRKEVREKRGVGRPRKKELVVATGEINSYPEQNVSTTRLPPSSAEPRYPAPPKQCDSRAKPMKSLYPQSKQNAFNHPTGHAVAHLPSDPAPEFGEGWITRTLMRPNSQGTKTSDT